MFGLILKLLTGPLLSTVSDIYKSYLNKQITEAECQAKIASALAPELSKIAEQQANVLVAEMQGNWLQRSWRPIVALAFASIPFFYGIVTPVCVAWFGMPAPKVGDQLLSWIMQAVMVCLGGYIGGKSLENITDIIGRYFGRK